MKTYPKFMTTTLLAAACCLFLGVGVARADDDEQGGDIDGTEQLDIDILMTPTAAAPPGSSIELSLEAEDDDGTTQATLKLETQGLPPGTYNVSVTLKSTGATVALGSFTVDSEGEAEIEFTTNPEGDEEEASFPANFNPFDIATVSVSNSSGVVLFTADLTSITAVKTMDLNANLQAKSGSSVSSANGNAVLSAHASGGKASGMLALNGHGLPPSKAMTLVLNHTNAKKVTTDSSGNVSVSLMPKGTRGALARGVTLFKVTSVSLRDKFGNVFLDADF
jgi:hypothetical protein